MSRRLLIGTSWKMNLTPNQAMAYLRTLIPLVADVRDRDIFVLPPFPALWVARAELTGTNIAWGAQDVHQADDGAHTGDVSAPMLAELGCRYVEIGHSERRRDHGETDAIVAAKARAALRHDMTPIVCVGERARVALPVARSIVARQLVRSLAGIDRAGLQRVVIAYEPVWAIGVGSTAAPPDHVAAMHTLLENRLRDLGANDPRVLYGGSIDRSNAAGLLAIDTVAGLFIGRAALDPATFAAIVRTRAGRSGHD